MANKNKSKEIKNKLNVDATSKEKIMTPEPDLAFSEPMANKVELTDDTNIKVPELCPKSINLDAGNEDEQHKTKLAAISTMSKRLDEQIINITDLQEQLSELQAKQMHQLDGCVNFFYELQGFEAKTQQEAKLVLDTFIEVKTKLKNVFEHYLPSEMNSLERDMKRLQVYNQSK